MEFVYSQLSQRALDFLEQNNSYRVLILLAGAPGSGKSTVAQHVVDELNNQYHFANNNSKSQSSIKSTKFNSNIDNYITSNVCDKIELSHSSTIIEAQGFEDCENEDFPPKKYYTENGELIISGRSKDNMIKLKVPDTKDQGEFAQIIPMDGFHLPRKTLSQFKDSKTAFDRRGSPYTFDSLMVSQLVKIIKSTCDVIITDACENIIYIDQYDDDDGEDEDVESIISCSDSSKQNSRTSSVSEIFENNNNNVTHQISISSLNSGFTMESNTNIWKLENGRQTLIPDIAIPNFNHSNKDPTPEGLIIKSSTKVLIMEGLYLLLNQGHWKEISSTEDSKYFETWKISIDENLARERVSKRHLESGIVNSIEEGVKRYDFNDCLNGRLVEKKSIEANIVLIAKND